LTAGPPDTTASASCRLTIERSTSMTSSRRLSEGIRGDPRRSAQRTRCWTGAAEAGAPRSRVGWRPCGRRRGVWAATLLNQIARSAHRLMGESRPPLTRPASSGRRQPAGGGRPQAIKPPATCGGRFDLRMVARRQAMQPGTHAPEQRVFVNTVVFDEDGTPRPLAIPGAYPNAVAILVRPREAR